LKLFPRGKNSDSFGILEFDEEDAVLVVDGMEDVAAAAAVVVVAVVVVLVDGEEELELVE